MAGIEVGAMTLKHTHPYTLEELHDLDTNHISEEILRLQKSIRMLESTNATLFDSVAASSSNTASSEDILSEEDSKLFQDTIQENEDAILAQNERIQMCIFVLKKRLGVDPTNKHYDLDPNTTAITARDVTPTPTSTARIQQIESQVASNTSTRQEATNQAGANQNENQEDDDQGGMYL